MTPFSDTTQFELRCDESYYVVSKLDIPRRFGTCVADLVVSKTATNPKRRQIQLDFSPKRCVYLYPKRRHAKTATKPKRRQVQLDFSPKRCVDLYLEWVPVKTAKNQNGDTSNLISLQNAVFTCIQDGDKSKTTTRSKLRHAPFWLSPFWMCRRFRCVTVLVVAVLECRRYGLVAVLACRRFGLWPFWRVAVLDLSPFWLSPFWICRRFDLYPSVQHSPNIQTRDLH